MATGLAGCGASTLVVWESFMLRRRKEGKPEVLKDEDVVSCTTVDPSGVLGGGLGGGGEGFGGSGGIEGGLGGEGGRKEKSNLGWTVREESSRCKVWELGKKEVVCWPGGPSMNGTALKKPREPMAASSATMAPARRRVSEERGGAPGPMRPRSSCLMRDMRVAAVARNAS